MKKLGIYICIIFLYGSFAAASNDTLITPKKPTYALVFVSLGMSLSAFPGSFFDKLESDFGLTKKEFNLSPNIYSGIKFDFLENYRIGLSADYFLTKLFNSGEQKVKTYEGTGLRYISQELELKTIPIILTAEYLPYRGQFRTYAGIGLGINYGKLHWFEYVNSNIFNDSRKGGLNYDSQYFAPVARLYTGVELGFDKEQNEHFIGSLILEFKFTFLFENVDVFKKVRSQFSEPDNDFNSGYSIISNYFNLNLAISFNISNNSGKIQKKK